MRVAQTNLQLFAQLAHQGYAETELRLARDAYALSIRLFTGRIQGTGRDFITHGVGTASVLAWIERPAPLVAAGLVHNAYQNGDFGWGDPGETPAKRRYVRRALGAEVEQYLHRFPCLTFNRTNTPRLLDATEQLDPIDREVVVLQLADRLEKHLDLDMAYCGRESIRDYYARFRVPTVETARRLGLPQLAVELESAYREVAEADVPSALVRSGKGYVATTGSRPLSALGRLRTQVGRRTRWLRSRLGAGGATATR